MMARVWLWLRVVVVALAFVAGLPMSVEVSDAPDLSFSWKTAGTMSVLGLVVAVLGLVCWLVPIVIGMLVTGSRKWLAPGWSRNPFGGPLQAAHAVGHVCLANGLGWELHNLLMNARPAAPWYLAAMQVSMGLGSLGAVKLATLLFRGRIVADRQL